MCDTRNVLGTMGWFCIGKCIVGWLAACWLKSKLKSKLAGPKAAPLGRKQMKCRILPDHLVYNVKNTKSCSDCIQWSYAAASTIQLPPPFELSRQCKQVFLISVVLRCSIPESCESNVPRAGLQHKKRTSILPRRMWRTKVSIQRSPTAPILCCSTHLKSRARVMPN